MVKQAFITAILLCAILPTSSFSQQIEMSSPDFGEFKVGEKVLPYTKRLSTELKPGVMPGAEHWINENVIYMTGDRVIFKGSRRLSPKEVRALLGPEFVSLARFGKYASSFTIEGKSLSGGMNIPAADDGSTLRFLGNRVSGSIDWVRDLRFPFEEIARSTFDADLRLRNYHTGVESSIRQSRFRNLYVEDSSRLIALHIANSRVTDTLRFDGIGIQRDLVLRHDTCGDLFLENCRISGSLVLGNVRVLGSIFFENVTIDGDILIDSSAISGFVFLSGTTVNGRTTIRSTEIGTALLGAGCAFKGLFSLPGSRLPGTVTLHERDFMGGMDLDSMRALRSMRLYLDTERPGNAVFNLNGDYLRQGKVYFARLDTLPVETWIRRVDDLYHSYAVRARAAGNYEHAKQLLLVKRRVIAVERADCFDHLDGWLLDYGSNAWNFLILLCSYVSLAAVILFACDIGRTTLRNTYDLTGDLSTSGRGGLVFIWMRYLVLSAAIVLGIRFKLKWLDARQGGLGAIVVFSWLFGKTMLLFILFYFPEDYPFANGVKILFGF